MFKKENKMTWIMFIVLIISSALSIFVGAVDLKTFEMEGFSSFDLILVSRLPRLLAVLCTGFGMSISGLIMQQVCSNKFVSPTTGATVSSAQFGILMTLVFWGSATLLQRTLVAFFSGLVGTVAFVWATQRIKFKDVVLVPLIGIMFGMVISGFTSFFAYRYGATQSLSAYLIGDFSLIIKGRYEIVYLVLPLITIGYLYANHFNIIGMGEDFANNLGVNYNVIMLLGLSIASMITASVIVVVGTVPYIGLIVPNMVSLFRGDKIRASFFDVGIIGSLFVLYCDIISRTIIHPYEIPINLISGVFGSAIFILFMILRLNHGKPNKKVKNKKPQLEG